MDPATNILLGDLLDEDVLNEWQPQDLWAFVHLIRKAQSDRMTAIGRFLTYEWNSWSMLSHEYQTLSDGASMALEARLSAADWEQTRWRIFPALVKLRIGLDGGPPWRRDRKPVSEASNGGQAAGSAVQASGPAAAPTESRRSAAARKAALARWSRGNASDANACESHPPHDAIAPKPHSAHENRISAHANRIESHPPHDAERAKSAAQRSEAPALQRTNPNLNLSSAFAPFSERTWNAEKPHSNAQNAVLMRSHAMPDATDAESAGRGRLVGGVSAGARAQSPDRQIPTKPQTPSPSPTGPDEYEVNWNEQLLSSAKWAWWEPQQVPAMRIRSLACGRFSTPARIAFILERIEAIRQDCQRRGKSDPNPLALLITGLGLSQTDPNAEPWHVQSNWFEQWARDPRVANHLRLHGEWKRLVAVRAKAQQTNAASTQARQVV